MGIAGSIASTRPSSTEGPTHRRVSDDEAQRASPLKTKYSDSYDHLCRETQGLNELIDRICIADIDSSYAVDGKAELNCNPTVLKKNLESIARDLVFISKLPTGRCCLETLSQFLADQNRYLIVSFVLENEDSASPKCMQAKFEIRDLNQNGRKEWNSLLVRLPERYEENYTLPFFYKNDGSVEEINEPTFLVILHELVHGLQYLQDTTSPNIGIDTINQQLPMLSSEKPEDLEMRDWIRDFFASTSGLWEYEVQTMITGVPSMKPEEIQEIANGIKSLEDILPNCQFINEAKALQEFLSGAGDLINNFSEVEALKGKKLYPFGTGSLDPQTQDTNAGMFNKFLDMLNRNSAP